MGQSSAFNRLNDWEKKVLLEFIQQTGLTIYQEWIREGRQQPLDNLISEAQTLMRGGVDNYLKSK